MTEREKGTVIQSVEDDRRFWLQACIGKGSDSLLSSNEINCTFLTLTKSAHNETPKTGQFYRADWYDPA